MLLLAIRCTSADKVLQPGDLLLAQVHNRTLYRSQLEGVTPEGAAPQDSTALVERYVKRWILDQVLLHEAERNIPKDLNIDELVRDYRASLVRFNYEERLIGERMDSVVHEYELRAYYEQHKDQFQLESTILKCQLLKLPANAPTFELDKLWRSREPEDAPKLDAYAEKWAVRKLLDRQRWHKLEPVAAILPEGTLTADNVTVRREGTLREGKFKYYYKVLDVVQGKATAPFDYARDQARKIILHHRKQAVIDRCKEELYQRELKQNNVKITY